jgi:hypothetical protein
MYKLEQEGSNLYILIIRSSSYFNPDNSKCRERVEKWSNKIEILFSNSQAIGKNTLIFLFIYSCGPDDFLSNGL